jgi:hypothetical protein
LATSAPPSSLPPPKRQQNEGSSWPYPFGDSSESFRRSFGDLAPATPLTRAHSSTTAPQTSRAFRTPTVPPMSATTSPRWGSSPTVPSTGTRTGRARSSPRATSMGSRGPGAGDAPGRRVLQAQGRVADHDGRSQRGPV